MRRHRAALRAVRRCAPAMPRRASTARALTQSGLNSRRCVPPSRFRTGRAARRPVPLGRGDGGTGPRFPDADIATVSHGDVIKALIARPFGAPLNLLQRVEIDPPSPSAIALGPGIGPCRVDPRCLPFYLGHG